MKKMFLFLFLFLLAFFIVKQPVKAYSNKFPNGLDFEYFKTYEEFFNYINNTTTPIRDINGNILSYSDFQSSLSDSLDFAQANLPQDMTYYAVFPVFRNNKITSPFSLSLSFSFKIYYFEDLETLNDLYYDIDNTIYDSLNGKYKTNILYNIIREENPTKKTYYRESSSSDNYNNIKDYNQNYNWNALNTYSPYAYYLPTTIFEINNSFSLLNGKYFFIEEAFAYNSFPDIVKDQMSFKFNGIYSEVYKAFYSSNYDNTFYNINGIEYKKGTIFDFNMIELDITSNFAVLLVPKDIRRYNSSAVPINIQFHYKGEVSFAWFKVDGGFGINNTSPIVSSYSFNYNTDFYNYQTINLRLNNSTGSANDTYWYYDDYVKENNLIVGLLIYNINYNSDIYDTFIKYDRRYFEHYIYDSPESDFTEIDYIDWQGISTTKHIVGKPKSSPFSSNIENQNVNTQLFTPVLDFMSDNSSGFLSLSSIVVLFFSSFPSFIQTFFIIIFILGVILTLKRWFWK